MHVILFDPLDTQQLLPLSYTRSIADMRCGILTLKEKWIKRLKTEVSVATSPILAYKYDLHITEDNLLVSSNIMVDDAIYEEALQLFTNEVLLVNDAIIARLDGPNTKLFLETKNLDDLDIRSIEMVKGATLQNCRDIFLQNGDQLSKDFSLLTQGKMSQKIPEHCHVIGDASQVFIAPGAIVWATTINVLKGPVYIGEHAEVMEGALLRGPIAVCEHASIKMGAKIYGDTTIGPHAKIGGEVGNVVVFGYSNKGHDGYLGNSVLGEWCNLGADTNSSNLKNNYSQIKAWSYETDNFEDTGLQFVGLIMGDHSKAGINTMFNTATTVGVAANIFGGGFPKKFVPSFTWGGIEGIETFSLDKSFEMAQNMMARRGIPFTEDDKALLTHIFNSSKKYRHPSF